MLKPLDLRQMQLTELGLLKEFAKICEGLGLRYSLGGGTLLGAVRHKGFIPWDDDIDVMMPRPDYDKFVEYCRNNEVPFDTPFGENNFAEIAMATKIYDRDTVLVPKIRDKDSREELRGLYIDIFPIDGLGDTLKAATKKFNSSSFDRELYVAASWGKFKKSKTHAWYLEPARFALFVLGRFANRNKLMKKIAAKYENIDFDKTEYAGVVFGSYRTKEIQPRHVFDNFTEVEFEGSKFKAIKEYDRYLSSNFGDYMSLPPEEKRVTHHSFDAYYADEYENEKAEDNV